MNETQLEAIAVIRNAVQARKAYSTSDLPLIPHEITDRLNTAALLVHTLYKNLCAGGIYITLSGYDLGPKPRGQTRMALS